MVVDISATVRHVNHEYPPPPPTRAPLSSMFQEGFEVVAIDLPGHGKSDAMSNDSWYQLLDYPEYVLEAAR